MTEEEKKQFGCIGEINLKANDECGDGPAGLGSTVYITGLGIGKVTKFDCKTKEPEPWVKDMLTPASFTIEGIVACPEIIRMIRDMTGRLFFPRKEVRRMRHFVTHGHDIWLRYLKADGERVTEIARTPRELRLLLEKIHYVRTDWFANRNR